MSKTFNQKLAKFLEFKEILKSEKCKDLFISSNISKVVKIEYSHKEKFVEIDYNFYNEDLDNQIRIIYCFINGFSMSIETHFNNTFSIIKNLFINIGNFGPVIETSYNDFESKFYKENLYFIKLFNKEVEEFIKSNNFEFQK